MRSLATLATTLTMAGFVVWMATFGARASMLFGETSVVQGPAVASAAQPHAVGQEG